MAVSEESEDNGRRLKRPRLAPSSGEPAVHQDGDPVVTLNVGGTIFQARCSSLTTRSRYFHNIYSGPFARRDSAEELFIDADPQLFRHVLHFLRRGRLAHKAPLEDLEHEARVYGIDELEEAVRRQQHRNQLVGTWLYARNQKEQFGFFISADGDSMLYQEVDASEEPPVIVQGELTEQGQSPGHYVAKLFRPGGDFFGLIRVCVKGVIMTFNTYKPEDANPQGEETGEGGSQGADTERLQWSRDSYAHRATATAQVCCENLPELGHAS
eukprot:TRINITY_DN52108_c0_g1_i1.p1 TRINITY_DN52108_c0_g1~~TRINITY_DN52108_c0_g1_i1.p1  ORF type:complete len:289 (-),score=55.11 TRINITY_DN52108_c0_g1_i1:30-836(-)